MTTADSQTDEVLVDFLDEALCAIRQGKSVDGEKIRETSPEFSEEGKLLLETLALLSTAAETWRDPNRGGTAAISLKAKCPTRTLPSMIGRYQIRGVIGSGGMGEVFEGFDPQLDRRVAVKVPHCDRLATNWSRFSERFIREARSAAAVRHAHICPVYDTGQHDDRPYVVMAFVEGESLETVLSRGRIEDVRRAVELTAQVAEALGAIHLHGIIHRDLKPGNILIDRSGFAVLTDFGLAVSVVNVERLTSDGLIVGTPVYMSPEQAAGENSTLTPAADIYSLGSVFYEMLTGSVPFRAPLLELLQRIKSEPPPPVMQLRPEVDPALSAIALKAMAKLPDDRFTSAEKMAAALREWLSADSSGSDATAKQAPTISSDVKSSNAKPWYWKFHTLLLVMTTSAILAAVWRRPADKSIDPEKPIVSGVSVAAAGGKAPVIPLNGEFALTISSDPEKGPVTKSRLRIEERGEFPLRNGELIQFEVHLNRPAYVYLLWVTPAGSVTPLYPWDAEHFEGFAAPRVIGSNRPLDHVICPSGRGAGFEAIDPVGLQTFVMLARGEPLPDGVNLEQLLANLPEGPHLDQKVAKVHPQLRGIKTGQTKSLDQALFVELESRLSPHFELVRMMTFPQVRD